MKTWLITGAASGLGRGMTERLLVRGDRVVATARRADALAADGARLRVATLDLTDTDALREMVTGAFDALGRIDIVVSNAGYGLFGAVEEVTDAQIARQVATNLVASIQLIRACLPRLRAQRGGRILQVSSEGGQIAYSGFGLYHATKWGIEGFVEAAAQEVAPFGIDFVLVEPGPTATGFRHAVDRAVPLPAYVGTPADRIRQAIDLGQFVLKGEAMRTVDAMIDAAMRRGRSCCSRSAAPRSRASVRRCRRVWRRSGRRGRSRSRRIGHRRGFREFAPCREGQGLRPWTG